MTGILQTLKNETFMTQKTLFKNHAKTQVVAKKCLSNSLLNKIFEWKIFYW